jgi:N-acyl amino acid synthase of PEP-CTERM/exosortase system
MSQHLILEQNRRLYTDAGYTDHFFERRDSFFKTMEANTEAEKEFFYQIRSDAFAKDLYILHDGASQNELSLKDSYDDTAIHFLTHFLPLKLVIGGMRFVCPIHHRGQDHFPSTEKSAALADFVAEKKITSCLEISRFMLSQKAVITMDDFFQKNPSYAVPHDHPPQLLYLIQSLFEVCCERKTSYVIGSFDMYLIRILKLVVGLEIEILGEAVYEDTTLHPFYIDVSRNIDVVREKNPRVFQFLTNNRFS